MGPHFVLQTPTALSLPPGSITPVDLHLKIGLPVGHCTYFFPRTPIPSLRTILEDSIKDPQGTQPLTVRLHNVGDVHILVHSWQDIVYLSVQKPVSLDLMEPFYNLRIADEL